MMVRRVLSILVLAGAGVALLAFLYDPPWVATTTSGMRGWEMEGTIPFRWTDGHAAFFAPSGAAAMVMPIRAAFARKDAPVRVRVAVDDRPVTEIIVTDPRLWRDYRIALPQRPTRRRYRRVDLRVSPVVGPFNLGVQVGETTFQP